MRQSAFAVPDNAERRVPGEASGVPFGPIAPEERVQLLDVLRGFALFGVLLANMMWVSQSALTAEQIGALSSFRWDRLAWQAMQTIVEWKFYTLFALLFGIGFALQLERAPSRRSERVYLRRMMYLGAIGLAHAYLIWHGDVLHLYALLGIVLLYCFRQRSDRTILLWGLVLAVFAPAGLAIARGLLPPWPYGEISALARGQRLDAYLHGSVWAFLRENAREALTFWASLAIVPFMLSVLGKFLLGVWIGRRRLLHDPQAHAVWIRRAMWGGLVVGLAGNVLWSLDATLREHLRYRYVLLANLPLYAGLLGSSVFYAAGIALLHERARWKRALSLLAPVGRMALTNYLLQSLVLVLLFYGVGFGLLGRAGAAACIPLTLAWFSIQVAYSRWWLQYFRFGPVEWLWRSLTYGCAQEFRLSRSMPPRVPSLADRSVPVRPTGLVSQHRRLQ